jgi:hypothetical protein
MILVFLTVDRGEDLLQRGVPVSRSILIGFLVLLITSSSAHAGSSNIRSIQDICYDAPQWLITLDKDNPLWLAKNLVNSTVTDWEIANYTEKMATLAVYLIGYEYKRDLKAPENDQNRKLGYQCTSIIEIMDQEIGKHYLPEDFPVSEFVHKMIEMDNLMASPSLLNGSI